MEKNLLAFLVDLAAVVKKHNGCLFYTTSDDGVHVSVGERLLNKQHVSIGWPCNGDSPELKYFVSRKNHGTFEKREDPSNSGLA
jgi:hypothetical protein